jgi:hypothetical protein
MPITDPDAGGCHDRPLPEARWARDLLGIFVAAACAPPVVEVSPPEPRPPAEAPDPAAERAPTPAPDPAPAAEPRWSSMAPVPEARTEVSVTTDGERIYLVGGLRAARGPGGGGAGAGQPGDVDLPPGHQRVDRRAGRAPRHPPRRLGGSERHALPRRRLPGEHLRPGRPGARLRPGDRAVDGAGPHAHPPRRPRLYGARRPHPRHRRERGHRGAAPPRAHDRRAGQLGGHPRGLRPGHGQLGAAGTDAHRPEPSRGCHRERADLRHRRGGPGATSP